MKVSNKLKNLVKKTLEFLQNIIAPEDVKIKRILEMTSFELRELLPRSAVAMQNVTVLFDYQNKLVRLIVKFIKYKNHPKLKEKIAKILYEEIAEQISDMTLFDGRPPILVPMPMTKKEKKERGFNQCEELALAVKKSSGNQIEISLNTLKKTRETARQSKLGRSERSENLKECMQAALRCAPGGPSFIILDDVYTTGASFAEARRALLSAGARSVSGLFIAH